MKKLFLCVWGDGYAGFTGTVAIAEAHGIDQFTEDNGYELGMIWRIEELEIGECIDLTDPSGTHCVVRLM